MQLDVQRREQVLAAAVQQGRILASGLPGYRARWDSDPAATERALAELQPVADICAAGRRIRMPRWRKPAPCSPNCACGGAAASGGLGDDARG